MANNSTSFSVEAIDLLLRQIHTHSQRLSCTLQLLPSPRIPHIVTNMESLIMRLSTQATSTSSTVMRFFSNVGGSLSHIFKQLAIGCQAVGHFFGQLGRASKNVALWIYRLPSNVLRIVLLVLTFIYKTMLIIAGVYAILILGYGVFRLGRMAWRMRVRQLCQMREEQEKRMRAERYRALEEQRAKIREIERVHREEQKRLDEARKTREAQERAHAETLKRQREEQKQRREAVQAEQRRKEYDRMYQTWKRRYDTIFAESPHSETVIPGPPLGPCKACPAQVQTCRHSVEQLFGATGNLRTVVKKERLRWHPDKFRRFEAVGVIGAEALATEVFKVIDSIHQSLAASQTCRDGTAS